MMKKVLIGIAIVLVGWALAVFIPWRADRNAGTQSPSADERPREVLTRFFTALNAGDEDGAIETLSSFGQQSIRREPEDFRKELAWDKRHPIDFRMISDTSDGMIGYVTYHFRRDWGGRVKDTIIQSQVFKEDGQWRVGGFPSGIRN